MEHATKFTSSNDVFRMRHSRKEAIVIPNKVRQARCLDGSDHGFALLTIEGEWFFTEDHFAMLDALQRDSSMRVVRRANVDRIDVLARHELAPVGLIRLVAPLFSEIFNLGFIATTDRFAHRHVFRIEEMGHLGECIRMGTAHKAIANHADVQLFFHKVVCS